VTDQTQRSNRSTVAVRGLPAIEVYPPCPCPRPDPSNLLAFPAAPQPNGRGKRKSHAPPEQKKAEPAAPMIVSGDALLLGLLALLNESTDMDRALQDGLDMMTEATRGCIGEIWLRIGWSARR